MAFRKGEFTITVGKYTIDLSEVDPDEWQTIEQFATFIHDEDPEITKHQAHCAGFLAYLFEMKQVHDFIDNKFVQKIH